MNNQEILDFLEGELIDRWQLTADEGGKSANVKFIIGYNKGTLDILKAKMKKSEEGE